MCSQLCGFAHIVSSTENVSVPPPPPWPLVSLHILLTLQNPAQTSSPQSSLLYFLLTQAELTTPCTMNMPGPFHFPHPVVIEGGSCP